MTDKQIIIDDYFTERTDEGGGTIGYYLIDDTALVKKIREQNEYIKAKEQECERWKKLYEEVCSENLKEIYELIKKNDLWREIVNVVNGKLEKQLDQLKEELEAYKMEVEEGKEINAELKATNEDLLSIQYKLADNNKQLRQTLAEIKEIAEFYCSCGHNQMCICNVCDKFEQVLQKISECEV